MSKQIATIPLSTIERIQIYINTAKKSLATIKAETGADYLINGGLYNMSTFKPVCHLKADGVVYAKDQYAYWGYSWNAADISMTVVPDSAKQNYICCNALIDANGRVDKLAYTSAQGGARGRTAIGIAGDKLCLYVSGDGTADAKTPEGLRDELIALGCTSALMLDSGGSSQCIFNETEIRSARRVHNFILVYLKKGKLEPVKEDTLAIKTICLDAGHGTGSVNGTPDGTYKEEEFTFDMQGRIKPLLERHGVGAVLTRPTRATVSLANRAKIANAAKVDAFVSLHSNAAGNGGWYDASGFLIYTSAAGDTAGRNILAKAIIARAKEAKIKVRNTALAHSMYAVLKNTTMPAVLIEYGFHTSKEDSELLKSSDYRDRLAELTANGILDYLGIAWADSTADQVKKRFDFADETMEYLAAYEYADALLRALATKK